MTGQIITWKASAVQQSKRFTLPLKGEALSPKTLVDTKKLVTIDLYGPDDLYGTDYSGQCLSR